MGCGFFAFHCIFFALLYQSIDMRKINIYDGDGKTREERETCFPVAKSEGKRKMDGVSTR